jgi:hypothetical protein
MELKELRELKELKTIVLLLSLAPIDIGIQEEK